jgi:hypothetical protein
MIAATVGAVLGAAVFALILYTGWERTISRWRATEDSLQRAAQVVVAVLSNLGLLALLTAGGAALAAFVAAGRDNPTLLTVMYAGGGLFIGALMVGFLLAVFIAGAGQASLRPRSTSRSRGQRKKRR